MNPHPKPTRRTRTTAAFTLVELLVTITIIIVLASLTYTGVSKMRAMAARSASMGNLSQLQIANANYAAENNGRYVSVQARDADNKLTSNWWNNTGFLKNFRGDTGLNSNGREKTDVPVSMLDPIAVHAKQNLSNDLRANYGGVVRTGTGFSVVPSDSSYLISELAQPHRTAAFTTATDWQVVYGSRFAWKGVEGKTGNGAMAYRHGNKALVAYFDGHVGELSMNDMKAFDQQGGKNHPFWDGAAK